MPTPARRRSLSRERFPEYVALSKPQPVSLAETQGLIADDEALLVFEFDTKSYAWIITRDGADWTELKISARDLDEQVRALRAWVVDPRQRFDSALAYKIFQETFGAFAEKLAAEKRLSIVTNGALTSLPPQLLIAKDPTGKMLKEMDWLIRSHAVTVLPSVASLKILRTGSQASSARKPMIAFADPVFSKAARANAQLAMRSVTSFYRGTQVDVAAIGEYLPQLPGTRKERSKSRRTSKPTRPMSSSAWPQPKRPSNRRSSINIASSISQRMGLSRAIWKRLPRTRPSLRWRSRSRRSPMISMMGSLRPARLHNSSSTPIGPFFPLVTRRRRTSPAQRRSPALLGLSSMREHDR